ncbi:MULTISPECIES: GNAT family N-acetyltransferase [Enterococcus]|nr:GNAT family N-acetyltransferase [Enterococcus faecalis]AFO43777.1 acetyltransferase (GNAT) family protein [Enterococcus faecalis D32]EEU65700.1 peptide chain release factor 1 [Enterococcus faecalis DS5]EEU73452.1 peptide chain release factor 1 [Enterococcus faecalis JH1]EFG20345.1 acetyltransferase, GNAT family [Enterococcus faecalis PC1.1]EOJ25506.1 acetyltransferase [Enterococcus faecalis EnGen0286]CWJ69773.1 acetyltransferase [Streptococcus pneumoniae]SJN52143.1 acetyltransferase, GNAT
MIRKMKPTDAAALTIINKEQLGYEVPVDVTCKQIEKLLLASDREFLYVYEETKTGKILGYVHAQLYETIYSQTLLNVLGLAVAKESEGRGIGKQLMTKLETEAKKCNLSAIRLNSGEQRTAAHQFYEHIGYVSDKKQKRFIKYLDT